MFTPAKLKHRKCFKGKIHGNSYAGSRIEFGDFAIKAIEPARMTSAQIESCRKTISRAINKQGKMWIRMFPHLVVSKKPADTRMGGGKGGIDRYVAKVYPGNIIFELGGVEKTLVYKAFKLAGDKLPFKIKIVEKQEGVHSEY